VMVVAQAGRDLHLGRAHDACDGDSLRHVGRVVGSGHDDVVSHSPSSLCAGVGERFGQNESAGSSWSCRSKSGPGLSQSFDSVPLQNSSVAYHYDLGSDAEAVDSDVGGTAEDDVDRGGERITLRADPEFSLHHDRGSCHVD